MKWRLFSFLMHKTGDPGRKKLRPTLKKRSLFHQEKCEGKERSNFMNCTNVGTIKELKNSREIFIVV
jgi:hypothetical protein